MLTTRKIYIKLSSFQLIMLSLFLFFLFVSSILNPLVRKNIGSFIVYIECVFFLLVISFLIDNIKKLFMIAWVLIISISILALVIILNEFNILHLSGLYFKSTQIMLEQSIIRAGSTIGDPNLTAAQLIISLPFIFIFYILYKKFVLRVFLILCTIIIVSAIIFTASLGGFIGLVFMVVLLFHFSYKIKFFCKKHLFVLTLTILVISITTIPNSTLIERAIFKYSLYEIGNSAAATSHRPMLWKEALKVVLHHPFYGVGCGNLTKAIGVEYAPGIYLGPHNTFLYIGVEGGAICLITFLMFISHLIYKLYKFLYKFNNIKLHLMCIAVFISLTTFLLEGMMVSLPKNKYLWLLLGIAVSISYIKNKKGYEYEWKIKSITSNTLFPN